MTSKELQNVKVHEELSGGVSGLLVIMFSFVSVYGICMMYGTIDLIPHANFIFSTVVFGLGFIIAHARIRYLEKVLKENKIDF